MFGLGTTELIVIGVIIFILFGAKRIPDIGKGLGGALREFRKVKRELAGTETKKDNGAESSIEGKVTEEVLKQVPGVKEAMDVKEKVRKAKEIVD
jgi:sec-independent protein translocase protein TatA